jgi:hypothetical protein
MVPMGGYREEYRCGAKRDHSSHGRIPGRIPVRCKERSWFPWEDTGKNTGAVQREIIVPMGGYREEYRCGVKRDHGSHGRSVEKMDAILPWKVLTQRSHNSQPHPHRLTINHLPVVLLCQRR